jgi:hypothetical protein
VKSGRHREFVDIRVIEARIELRGTFPFAGRLKPWLRRDLADLQSVSRARSDWWMVGYPSVILLFKDGRTVKLAARGINGLVEAIEDVRERTSAAR